MNKKVSIIMPMYNAEKYIKLTIDTVISQTYDDWELLITDDGSKDKSVEIVEELAKKDSRIKLFKQKNAGAAAARNNSLKHSLGRYIAYLDSDDLWDETFLEEQISFLEKENAALVSSSYRRIDENGNEKLEPFIVPKKADYKDILKTCSLSCLTSLYDTEKIEKEFFNTELGSLRDDFAMWLAILRKGVVVIGNKKILASYRVFNASTTGNKKKLVKPQFMVYYKIEKLGLIKSVYYTCWWAYNGLKKYKK